MRKLAAVLRAIGRPFARAVPALNRRTVASLKKLAKVTALTGGAAITLVVLDAILLDGTNRDRE
jgi:hypothetical protein